MIAHITVWRYTSKYGATAECLAQESSTTLLLELEIAKYFVRNIGEKTYSDFMLMLDA